MPDSLLILRAYKKWGIDCVSNLRGDFSFAIYDEPKQRLFIARDHFGMKPLFYYDHPEFFVFSTELRGILALPFFEKRLNEGWFFDFLINATRKEFDTFYERIFSIPPGHQLIVENGKVSMRKYWELTVPERLILKNDADYIAGYKELFDASVKNRIRSAFPVGAELSGGLDSSSIAAVAQKFLKAGNKELHVFSRVLPEKRNLDLDDNDDESSEIKLVCDFCGIKNIHRVTMEDQKITENIRQINDVIRSPYRGNYAAYNLNVNQTAQQAGVRTILSGHGGDQMVSNHAGFVYKNFLRQHWYLKLFADIRAKETIHEIDLIKTLKIFFRLRSEKYDFSKKQNELKKMFKFGINEALIEKFEMEKYYLNSRKNEILTPENSQDMIKKITHRHLNDRVEVMNLVAGQVNIEFRYPLFDVDLIEYYLAVPDELKHKFRQGRYIHRIAMQDLLPPSIQWRKDKHGTINPGLARIYANDASAIKTTFNQFLKELPKQNTPVFDKRMIEKLIFEPDEKLFGYKSVINKYYQLTSFEKIIENKFAV